jgi:hypothetical protein
LAANGQPGVETPRGKLGAFVFKACAGPVRRAARAMARMADRLRKSSPALLRGGGHPPKRHGFRVIGQNPQNPPAWDVPCGGPAWTSIAAPISKPRQDDRGQAYLPPPLPPRSPQLRAWTGSAPLPPAPSARPAVPQRTTSALSASDQESPYTELSFQRPRQAASREKPSTVAPRDQESPYDQLSFTRSGKAPSAKNTASSLPCGEEPVYTGLSQKPSKPVDGA